MDTHQIRNGYASLKIFVSHYFAIHSFHSFILKLYLTLLCPAALEINVVIVLILTPSFVVVIIRNGVHLLCLKMRQDCRGHVLRS